MTERIERLDVEAAHFEDELLIEDELSEEALDRPSGRAPLCILCKT